MKNYTVEIGSLGVFWDEYRYVNDEVDDCEYFM